MLFRRNAGFARCQLWRPGVRIAPEDRHAAAGLRTLLEDLSRREGPKAALPQGLALLQVRSLFAWEYFREMLELTRHLIRCVAFTMSVLQMSHHVAPFASSRMRPPWIRLWTRNGCTRPRWLKLSRTWEVKHGIMRIVFRSRGFSPSIANKTECYIYTSNFVQ